MGAVLGIFLVGGLLFWSFIDFLIWRSGGETFSQWVVNRAKKKTYFAVHVLLIIVLLGLWLIVHWQLIPIIWG